jgi:predicted enzyme related to lactoylglutathione lyase
MSNPVVHWEIGGRDAGSLRDFYRKAFGWHFTDAGPQYTLVQPENGGLGGGIMQVAQGASPYVTIYISVDDLDLTLTEIQRLGGRTVVPPTAISDVASFALFADPEGTVVGLLKTTGPIYP